MDQKFIIERVMIELFSVQSVPFIMVLRGGNSFWAIGNYFAPNPREATGKNGGAVSSSSMVAVSSCKVPLEL